jgi:hypothetical protein
MLRETLLKNFADDEAIAVATEQERLRYLHYAGRINMARSFLGEEAVPAKPRFDPYEGVPTNTRDMEKFWERVCMAFPFEAEVAIKKMFAKLTAHEVAMRMYILHFMPENAWHVASVDGKTDIFDWIYTGLIYGCCAAQDGREKLPYPNVGRRWHWEVANE